MRARSPSPARAATSSGKGTVAIIDPGPEDDAHVARLLDAIKGETVTPHRGDPHPPRPLPGRPRHQGGDRGAHRRGRAASRSPPAARARGISHGRQRTIASTRRTVCCSDGDCIGGPGWTLEAVETPGHTANHLAFALPEENALVLRRPRDGVVDHRRRPARRRDGRLHGLVGEAAANAPRASIGRGMAGR